MIEERENIPWKPISAFGGFQKVLGLSEGARVMNQRELLGNAAEIASTLILHPNLPSIPDLPRMVQSRENNFLGRCYSMFQTLQRVGPTYMNSFKNNYVEEVREAANRVRNRREYTFLDSLAIRVRELVIASDFELRNVFSLPLNALYSVISERDRFLVSAKTRPVWKEVHLKNATNTEFRRQHVSLLGDIPERLHEFDQEDTIVIPDYFLHPDDLPRLSFSEPEQTVEESLEQAYYRKHYIVPPEGAVVFVSNGGDIKAFTIKEKGKMLWAKVHTDNGEYLLGLDLDNAVLDTRQWRRVPGEGEMEDRLAKVLALIYRDMVVSIDVFKSPRTKSIGANAGVPSFHKEYQWIYIPRKRRIPILRKDHDVTGQPHKSPRPHRVSGFKRKGNLTAKHELKIREFEQETGIRVLENLPEGYTFVKPHVRPKGTLERELAKLPKFIKRRIEEDLRGPIRVQL